METLTRAEPGHRSTHSNPIVETVFQRFERGENLLSIFENITGWKWTKLGNERGTDPVERFMIAFVLGTIAPGSEFQRDERLARTKDLDKPQDQGKTYAG